MLLITLVIVYQIIAITFAWKEYSKIITYYPITLLPYYPSVSEEDNPSLP